MKIKKMMLTGLLGIGLLSATAMQSDYGQTRFLGLWATITGAALSCVLFERAAYQQKQIEVNKRAAEQFKGIKARIDGLSERLSKDQSGTDIKIDQESGSIKELIKDFDKQHGSYVKNVRVNPVLSMVFNPLISASNSNELLQEARERQKLANEQTNQRMKKTLSSSIRSFFSGWLQSVKQGSDSTDAELKKRSATLELRKKILSRLGIVCAGFSIINAAVLAIARYAPGCWSNYRIAR